MPADRPTYPSSTADKQPMFAGVGLGYNASCQVHMYVSTASLHCSLCVSNCDVLITQCLEFNQWMMPTHWLTG